LFLIVYNVSQPETSEKMVELAAEFNVSDTTSKLISAGLWTVLGLIGVACVSFIFSEIRNAFK